MQDRKEQRTEGRGEDVDRGQRAEKADRELQTVNFDAMMQPQEMGVGATPVVASAEGDWKEEEHEV